MIKIGIALAVLGVAFVAWALVHEGKKQDTEYEDNGTGEEQLFI